MSTVHFISMLEHLATLMGILLRFDEVILFNQVCNILEPAIVLLVASVDFVESLPVKIHVEKIGREC